MELITLGLVAAFLTYEINRSHTDRLFNAASRLGAGDLYGARTLLSVVKWSPALGKQRNLWALCLNLDAHLDIIAGEENTARQKIDKILSKPGLLPAIRGLVFQREAELQASWPEKRQAFLDQAESNNEQLSPWQQANVRAMRRSHRRASAVPESLVRASQIASTRCVQAWRIARGNNDWPAVSVLLEEEPHAVK